VKKDAGKFNHKIEKGWGNRKVFRGRPRPVKNNGDDKKRGASLAAQKTKWFVDCGWVGCERGAFEDGKSSTPNKRMFGGGVVSLK